jgi:hypothetical protein
MQPDEFPAYVEAMPTKIPPVRTLEGIMAPQAEIISAYCAFNNRLHPILLATCHGSQNYSSILRPLVGCFAREDYEGAMKTGVVCRKHRMIGSGNNACEVVEYEINSALIEALNSVEKRAAIETGQEVDRSDIGVRFGIADQAAVLQRAFTLDELEAIEARIQAARNGTQVIDAPAVVVPEVQPFLDKTQGRSEVAAAEAGDQAGSEGPGKPGCAAPTAIGQHFSARRNNAPFTT